MKKLIVYVLFISCFAGTLYAQRAGTRTRSDSVIVTSTGITVSAGSLYRMSEVLVNASTGNVWVSFTDSAYKSQGFLLRPAGSIHYGAYTLIPWNGVVYAISDSATALITRSTVFIQ